MGGGKIVGGDFMKKSIIISISCILLICIIVFTFFYETDNDGKSTPDKPIADETSQLNPDIYNEINREMMLWKDGETLYFTNPDYVAKAFSYNTANGELKEHTSENAYKNIRYEDDTYIFINNWEGVYCLDKKSGEKHYIYGLKNEQENDGFAERYGITSVDVTSAHYYGGKLYFSQTVYNNVIEDESKLFSFDPITKEKKEFLANENTDSFTACANKIYFVCTEDELKIIKCYDLETGKTSTVTKVSAEYVSKVYVYKSGIYYTSKDRSGNYTLNTHNISTKETKKANLQNGSLLTVTYSETNDEFFVKFFDKVYKYYLITGDLKDSTDIKELPAEPLKIELDSVTSIAEINGKYYYGVFRRWSSNNDFAVYSIDSNGNLAVITVQCTLPDE